MNRGIWVSVPEWLVKYCHQPMNVGWVALRAVEASSIQKLCVEMPSRATSRAAAIKPQLRNVQGVFKQFALPICRGGQNQPRHPGEPDWQVLPW